MRKMGAKQKRVAMIWTEEHDIVFLRGGGSLRDPTASQKGQRKVLLDGAK